MLVAGIVFLAISLTPLRAWIINSIPKSLKLGIGAGIGLFLAIIGLRIMGVVVDHPVTLVKLGNLKDPIVILACLAFVAMIVLEKLKEQNLLAKEEKHTISVPRGERSNMVIEPRLSFQWYVKTKEMAAKANEAVNKKEVVFHPENWIKTYFNWISNWSSFSCLFNF